MKVITGSAKGKPLKTLEGADIVRPTSQKVKEGIFSAIQFNVPGARVLDLFAGSGQLGIEALSRDASLCVFVDQSREAANTVIENLKYTNLFAKSRVITSEATRYLSFCKDEFDIVFIDPPYRKELVDAVMPLVSKVISEDGMVICETEIKKELEESYEGLTLAKKYKYGKTLIWRYQKSGADKQSEAE